MARKNGCPTSVRDWTIDVENPAQAEDWIRVKGIDSLTYSRDSDTEDGSSASDLYSENYKTKLNLSLSLEAKPVVDIVTGAHDRGQQILDDYYHKGGCEADLRMKITDNCGHSEILTVIVTSTENSADETSESRSWDMDVVGEPEFVEYNTVKEVELYDGESKLSGGTTSGGKHTYTAISINVGTPKTLTAKFIGERASEPASNQKYSVASADTTHVKVSNVDGLTFSIMGVSSTGSGNPVNVVVRAVNTGFEAIVPVNVTAGA